MPADVLETPVAPAGPARQGSATSPIAIEVVRPKRVESQESISGPSNSKPASRRQRIAVRLREIFEGHNEFLGCTPD